MLILFGIVAVFGLVSIVLAQTEREGLTGAFFRWFWVGLACNVLFLAATDVVFSAPLALALQVATVGTLVCFAWAVARSQNRRPLPWCVCVALTSFGAFFMLLNVNESLEA